MTPTLITAHLDTPVIGEPPILDGPLAWAAAITHPDPPPITPDCAPDFDLPLGRWEQDGFWGWQVSRPHAEMVHHSTVESRRRPAVGPMARYTTARDHHAGLGPMKARNTVLAAAHATRITWHAVVTDSDLLHQLLGHITHLGARHRDGYGHVARWETSPSDDPDGWRDRPMPDPDGQVMRVRAPYWHPTERCACAG